MMDDTSARRTNGLRINYEVSLGAILQASVVACGLVGWAVTSANRSDQAQHDLTTMQQTVSGQITDLRSLISSGLADVRAQIQTLPDQRARLDQAERRMSEVSTALGVVDSRLRAVEQSVAELNAQLGSIGQASRRPR